MFSYVHVEEEQVGTLTMGAAGKGAGEPDRAMLQRRQQSVSGVLRLAAAVDEHEGEGDDEGRNPAALDE